MESPLSPKWPYYLIGRANRLVGQTGSRNHVEECLRHPLRRQLPERNPILQQMPES